MAPELNSVGILSLVSLVMLVVLGGISLLAHIYNLNNIKSKTVGDGQHGRGKMKLKRLIYTFSIRRNSGVRAKIFLTLRSKV